MSSALASLSGIALRGRTSAAVALLAFALTLPALAIQGWSSAYVDSLGKGIAACLIAVAPSLPSRAEPEDWNDSDEVEPPDDPASTVPAIAVDPKRPHPRTTSRAAPKHGIRISSAQVLALASRRAMPSAVFVKASPEHPAGLLLGGVSGLGVGLQDGDVLTEAAGQKATSVAQVVGIVLAARSRQAGEISGRFYRGGVPFSLTVEQPYPKPPVPG